MATTAVFVELLIVGLQAMIWIVGLIVAIWGTDWIVDSEGFLHSLSSPILAGLMLSLFAVSYTVGIVIDRLSDAILGPLGRRISATVNKEWTTEDKWSASHYEVLHASTGMGTVTEYIRSRMRVVRGLVVNAPLTTIAAGLAVEFQYKGTDTKLYLSIIGLVGFAFTVLVLIAWAAIARTWYVRIQQAHRVLHRTE